MRPKSGRLQRVWGEAVVFISHSSADKPLVRFFASELTHCGYQCWLDENELEAGQSSRHWPAVAVQASSSRRLGAFWLGCPMIGFGENL